MYENHPPAYGGLTGGTPENRPARIMVIDDDQATRELLSLILAEEGYEVGSTDRGEGALDRIRRFQPDLVLLDLRLVDMDGHYLIQQCREMAEGPVPVIVVTAAPKPAERAAQTGADAFLPKPFDIDELLTLVRRFTARSSDEPRERGQGEGKPHHRKEE